MVFVGLAMVQFFKIKGWFWTSLPL